MKTAVWLQLVKGSAESRKGGYALCHASHQFPAPTTCRMKLNEESGRRCRLYPALAYERGRNEAPKALPVAEAVVGGDGVVVVVVVDDVAVEAVEADDEMVVRVMAVAR